MLNLTNKSEAISHLLVCMKSCYRNIGIVGNYYYGIGSRGVIHRFDLRPYYQTDHCFPGIRQTKTRIGAKAMVEILLSIA